MGLPVLMALIWMTISGGHAAAFTFRRISTKARSRADGKTIEIAGIGSMVYAFLVVSPMHDPMVSIALLLFVIAMLAVLHCLYRRRARRLFSIGLLCLALLLVTAVVYYGNVVYDALPVLQKLSFIVCAGWLFAVYYSFPDGAVETAHSA